MSEIFNNIYKKIEQAPRIIIHRHQNPDPDALGSQYGMKYLILESFPNKEVKCYGSIPNTLSFLAEEETVTETDYQDALVLVMDTANVERIDGRMEWMKKSVEMIKIDHHPNNDHYAKVEYVDTSASSTSEIVYSWFESMGSKLTMTASAAKMLYAGIIGDTGRFMHTNTTSKTLHIASELRRYPFDFAKLNQKFIEKTKEQVYLSGYVQSNFKINDAGVAYIILTNEILQKYHVTHDETSTLVGLLGSVDEVKSWVMFIEKADYPGVYRCRLRSKKVPIEPIARKHDGGGHPLASGANAYSLSEIDEIISEMTNNLIENKS